MLRKVFAELQRSGEVSPQIKIGPGFEKKTFDELGLDSVNTVTIAAAVEEKTGVVLSEEDFSKDMTVSDLARIIGERIAA
jgi:acyl carrier protein